MKQLHVFTLPCTPEAFFDGQYKYLTDRGHDITVMAAEPLNGAFCSRNGVQTVTAPMARAINPLADVKAIGAVGAEIRRGGYDMVVGHTPKGAMVAMIAARLAGVRSRVYYRHGLVYTTATGLKRRILKAVERLTAAFATRVVNVSPSLSELAVKDGLNSAAKQTVIGAGTCGGIDTERTFNPAEVSDIQMSVLRDTLGLGADDFVIGFCGRICKEKGIRELVDGFKLYHSSNPRAKLLLVGPYDSRDILPDDYKLEIESNPNIIATGRIDKADLPRYYSIMDLFVFPSYREGFGMCVLEASAMQLPVLVSRSHGCVDSINPGITGEYIDLAPQSICQGISDFEDVDKRKPYGVNGRRWVVENFDQGVLWPRIADFYDSL